MHEKTNFISENEKCLVADVLSSTVGEDVVVGLRKLGIDEKHSNSKGNLKWDIINKSFISKFNGKELTARFAKRRGWNMAPLVDLRTGFIYTLMSESRFKELRRKKSKRKNEHYLDAFVKSFNSDFKIEKQVGLFDGENSKKDEKYVGKIVKEILEDMRIDYNIIQRYAIILFNEFNHEIVSLRCCVLNSELDIVEEENWSDYIQHREPVIIDRFVSVSDDQHIVADIPLSSKAMKKIAMENSVEENEDDSISKYTEK